MNEEEKIAVEFVKKRTKELKKYAKRENELVYDDIILNLINKLQKENEELKKLMAHKNWYTQKLEEDLFENASNYVIKKQKVKDKIEELKKKVGELTDDKGYWGGSDLLEQIKVLQELLEKEQ